MIPDASTLDSGAARYLVPNSLRDLVVQKFEKNVFSEKYFVF